jgi:hypothetical protein
MANDKGLLYPGPKGSSKYPLPLEKGTPGDEKAFCSVDRLKAGFRDLARPNLFKVDLHGPPVLGTDAIFSLMCKAASFPGMEVTQIPLPRGGNTVHLPGDTRFEEFTVSFYNDVDFAVRSMFHRWQRLFVSNWVDGFTGIVLENFNSTVGISQFDNNFNVTYYVQLFNAWPSRIGGINLSMEDLDNREDFQVAFSYTYYEVKSG